MLTDFQLTGQIESNYDEVIDSFDSMSLKPELLRGMPLPWRDGMRRGEGGEFSNGCAGVYAYGFERPSAIQQRAIMPIIKGEFL